jgi:hypothetical protein
MTNLQASLKLQDTSKDMDQRSGPSFVIALLDANIASTATTRVSSNNASATPWGNHGIINPNHRLASEYDAGSKWHCRSSLFSHS